MHEFLAKLTDLHHKMLGLSVVYVPQEGLLIPAEVAAEDKELVRRLEGKSQPKICLTVTMRQIH